MASAYQSYSQPNFDVEKGASLNEFADRIVRQGFIKKVFGLLAAQLALTALIGGAFVFTTGVKAFVATNPWVLMVAFVVSFVLVITLSVSAAARQTHPTNLILLFTFTAAEGVLVGAASSAFSTDIVVLAFGLTAGITTGLAFYAMNTKKDFTTSGAVLYSVLLSLCLVSLAGFFMRTPLMNLLISGVGAILFSFYIVYDVQMLLGGDHKYQLSPDEYVFGAIAIYLDVINLFIYILRILGERNN